ncbi:hypothetical protein ACU4GD_31915 [Cupriavidus basilensis]
MTQLEKLLQPEMAELLEPGRREAAATGCPTGWGRLVGQAMGQFNVDCALAQAGCGARGTPARLHAMSTGLECVLLVGFADID